MIIKVSPWQVGQAVPTPIDLYNCNVIQEWVDYNNHMTEAAYLTAFGWASDVLFQLIGINDEYRAAGKSFYTVETHIVYQLEAAVDEPLRVTTQVLGRDVKRVHIYHEMFHGLTGAQLATCEQLLVHVDSTIAKSCPITASVAVALDALTASHRSLGVSDKVGRIMKIKQESI